MSDTFDIWLAIRLIQTGAYNNTWGAVLNADALANLADAIAGRTSILLTGLTYSLPALSPGSDSDSRAAILRFTGSPSDTVTVTIPGSVVSKLYLIDNRCGQSIIFTYGSGSTVEVATGVKQFIQCDGTEVTTTGGGTTDSDNLGGIAAAYWARKSRTSDEIDDETYLLNSFDGVVNANPWVVAEESPSTVLDAKLGNLQRLTLTADRIIDEPINPVDGQLLVLQLRQDAVGGRLVTAWHSSFLFENGLAPTLAPTANAMDLFLMFYDADIEKWIVGHFGSVASATGASYNLTLESNQCDVSLAAIMGSVPVASVVNLTIAQGAVLQALSAGSYALDLSNVLPVGSTLNLINYGYILGHGGDGGCGGQVNGDGVGESAFPGQAGGTALRAPGSGITFNITNASGYIWGGGGGGGGGGPTSSNGVDRFGKGGGGGGGAGGGRGGQAGKETNGNEYGAPNLAGNGTDGSTGVGGTFGGGGGGAVRGGAFSAGGGDGGDWGTAGTAGSAGTVSTHNITVGAAGAAGKAIELNGGTASFVNGSGSPNVKGVVA